MQRKKIAQIRTKKAPNTTLQNLIEEKKRYKDEPKKEPNTTLENVW